MLKDAHGRPQTYLRISVTDRCNLRCRYCLPPDRPPPKPRAEILSFEEIVRVARVAVDLGVKKIRLTGGEPLLRRGLVKLVRGLAGIDGLATVALTTNGVLLASRAEALADAGLGAVNLSLDTLRPDRFTDITGQDLLTRVHEGLEAALGAGFATVKLNVVVMRGVNDDELLDFAELARERAIDVRFIEHMPMEGDPGLLVPWTEMRERIESDLEITAIDNGAVAREYEVAGFAGRIGFITPVTERFCSNCGRLRLAADGALRACLLGAPAGDVRLLLRSGAPDEALAEELRSAAAAKPRAGVPDSGPWPRPTCMAEIGG